MYVSSYSTALVLLYMCPHTRCIGRGEGAGTERGREGERERERERERQRERERERRFGELSTFIVA